MRKLIAAEVVLTVGTAIGLLFNAAPQRAEADGNPLPPCQDVNGDGSSDLSDAIYFLQWHFLGGPEPVCPARIVKLAGLPDTGQTACYNDPLRCDQGFCREVPCDQAICAGQDGSHAAGCSSDGPHGSGRFADNGDGTVTDTCTGLMWQKDTADTNGDGQSAEADQITWCDALAYCENLSLAGHDDWRLPSVRELESIADYGRLNPAIDPVFPAFRDMCWSSTTLSYVPQFAWRVMFNEGHVGGELKGSGHYVRAVRTQRAEEARNVLPPCQDLNGDGSSDVSDAIYFLEWHFLGGAEPSCPTGNDGPSGLPDTGQAACYNVDECDPAVCQVPCDPAICPGQDGSYATGCPSVGPDGSGRFVDNGDGTVTDTCTGLMWQKDTADTNGDGEPAGDEITWCNALAYCENLSFAGHDDWRLPNVRELESIIDYGRFQPPIDPVFGVLWEKYWSSTSTASGTLAAWIVTFDYGSFTSDHKAAAHFVRAVRTGP